MELIFKWNAGEEDGGGGVDAIDSVMTTGHMMMVTTMDKRAAVGGMRGGTNANSGARRLLIKGGVTDSRHSLQSSRHCLSSAPSGRSCTTRHSTYEKQCGG